VLALSLRPIRVNVTLRSPTRLLGAIDDLLRSNAPVGAEGGESSARMSCLGGDRREMPNAKPGAFLTALRS
jgi:hypothetical protein